ncbi:phage tail protein [Pseudomonas sp. ArH3a]|uniref:phage tail protein n=1 Tax=Pseudomonas sp. ArH3a TaxID=2862945 RepID=UPI001F576B86|nr:phage tail protein [Pseudomonas sp. ArH3a]UNM17261.1 phage tail protein [Pseudomonas sp. ArH3a]UNM18030.1 phage tail protein [Pseudomonas sp. ArH3a]
MQNGSNTVVGTNVDFAASSRNGDSFVGPDGATYELANVASSTVISILPPYKGPTVSGAAYAIMPVQGYDKMLSDAFNALNNQFGAKLAALGTTGNYDILPVVKGGTGSNSASGAQSSLGLKDASAALLLANLGIRGSATGFGINGLYVGWNGESASGSANFIVNRGGGLGGFSFRSVNSNNTESGPITTLSYEGVLNVPGGIQLNGKNLVERGSNANGDYVRLADGTQICWKRITTDASSNAIGAIYGSGAFGAGPFPASFTEIPKIVHSGYIASGTVNAMWSSCYSTPSQTSWGNYRMLSAGSYGAGYIDVVAVGRWF